MKKLLMTVNKSSIQHFFQSNTFWIHVVVLLLCSALSTSSVMRNDWPNYSYYSLAFCGIYFPILLFALFRKQLVLRLPKWGLRGLWVLCFLVYVFWVYFNRNGIFAFLYPLDVFTNGIKRMEDVYVFRSGFLSTLSFAIIGTEVAILVNDYFIDWARQNRLLKRLPFALFHL